MLLLVLLLLLLVLVVLVLLLVLHRQYHRGTQCWAEPSLLSFFSFLSQL
eukprot:COSAG02_NODE_55_length_43887_cov_30.660364_14_plen_49_part_00